MRTKTTTMTTDQPSPDHEHGAHPPRSDPVVGEILDSWLNDLVRSYSAEDSDELTQGYRELAATVLAHSLRTDARWAPPPLEELDRALTSVARASRRARRSISSTLERFGRLTPTVVETLSSKTGVSEESAEVLEAAVSVDHLLRFSMQRLVGVLEGSAARAGREQADALAAMTDVLSHELDNRLGAARTASDMLLSARVELSEADLTRVGYLVRSSVDDAMRTVDVTVVLHPIDPAPRSR